MENILGEVSLKWRFSSLGKWDLALEVIWGTWEEDILRWECIWGIWRLGLAFFWEDRNGIFK